jgi:hypothetical protein
MNPKLSFCRPLLLLNQIKHSKRGLTVADKTSLPPVLGFGAVEDSKCRFIFAFVDLSTGLSLYNLFLFVIFPVYRPLTAQ